jgi:hypothetical protein
MPVFLKLLQRIERVGTLSNSSYKASLILLSKPDTDITEKENYRTITLMNIHSNIFNKMLVNQIQQHFNKFINHDQVGFISGMPG